MPSAGITAHAHGKELCPQLSCTCSVCGLFALRALVICSFVFEDSYRPSHMTPGSQCVVISCIFCSHTLYSLRKNNISDVGAQALAKGLQHCTNLQHLE